MNEKWDMVYKKSRNRAHPPGFGTSVARRGEVLISPHPTIALRGNTFRWRSWQRWGEQWRMGSAKKWARPPPPMRKQQQTESWGGEMNIWLQNFMLENDAKISEISKKTPETVKVMKVTQRKVIWELLRLKRGEITMAQVCASTDLQWVNTGKLGNKKLHVRQWLERQSSLLLNLPRTNHMAWGLAEHNLVILSKSLPDPLGHQMINLRPPWHWAYVSSPPRYCSFYAWTLRTFRFRGIIGRWKMVFVL